MKRFPILLAAMAAVPGIATELHVFSAGQAAKAQEVNDNFQRLDTAIQNRATKADSATLAKATLDSATSLRKAIDASQAQAQPYLPINDPVYTGGLFGPGSHIWRSGGVNYFSVQGTATDWVLRDLNADGSLFGYPIVVNKGAGGKIRLGVSGGIRPLEVGGTLTINANAGTGDRPMVATPSGLATTVDSATFRAKIGALAQNNPEFTGSIYGPGSIVWKSGGNTFFSMQGVGVDWMLRALNDNGSLLDYPIAIAREAGGAIRIGVSNVRPIRLGGEVTNIALAGTGTRPMVASATGVLQVQDAAAFRTTIDAAQTVHDHDSAYVKVTGGTITGDLRVSGKLTTPPGTTPADYVFEPDYKLASLPEIEAFTKANKHLPEVPSAAEIEKGGLDLAKMNLTLLKKVEELTLHAIAQNKQLEAQAAQIQAQNERLQALEANRN